MQEAASGDDSNGASRAVTPSRPERMRVERLPHGYTNDTRRSGGEVVKRYVGPDADRRRHREGEVLAALAGLVPVPGVLSTAGAELRMALVHGRPGQELIDQGQAAAVLAACGRVLRQIHAADVRSNPGLADSAGAPVLVHGDFGPNNVLIDEERMVVTAVVDWEWAHLGAPIEDLAWCEWIVRMHHPASTAALVALFTGYGARPSWQQRQEAMVTRCEELLDFTTRWDQAGPGAAEWRRRLRLTASWTECD